MMQDLSTLESAIYIGICNHGLTVPVLSRMLHVSWRQANALMDTLDAFGIRFPFEAVEPDYEMDGKVRDELESMLNRARACAGLPPIQKYRRGTPGEVTRRLHEIDQMTGREFEEWCGQLLSVSGFDDVQVTQYTGDSGVDIIAEKDGEKWAIQCKRYKNNVGNSAVQEVVAGKALYECQRSLIITSSWYTGPAKKLARSNQTELWDRIRLRELLAEHLI